MLDEKAFQSRPPFDVTTIDEGISALVGDRAAPVQRSPLRRLANGGDRPALGPTTPNHPTVEEPAGAADVAQGGEASRPIEEILAERGKTHGDFTDNARVMQSLKRTVHSEAGWDRLTDVQREALHMILHKVGRIISGNPNVHDHWDDIAGYAKLASERIDVG